MWLEKNMDNRKAAAQFVSRRYYNQDPRLLDFVLSKTPDRVRYNDLTLQRSNFEEIEKLAKQSGIIEGKVSFDDYVDVSFGIKAAEHLKSYDYKAEQAMEVMRK